VVNNPSLVITSDSKLVGDLGLESIDLLDVSSELENTVGREIDFREVAEAASKKSGQRIDMKGLTVSHLIEFLGEAH
jgi:acyl carrier protein